MLPILLAKPLDSFFSLFDPNNWFRQVPEGMEFVGVLLTIIGSLAILTVLGAWWQR